MGRPKKKIDPDIVAALARRWWTKEQIASTVGCSVDTLERNFAGIIKENRHKGSAILRDMQWGRCKAGSDKMIIHMSAHILGEHQRNVTKIEDLNDDQFNELLEKIVERINRDGSQ